MGRSEEGKGGAEKFFEAGGAGFALGLGDGGIGGALVIAEIEKSGFDVGLGAGRRRGGGFLGLDGHSFEFVFQFDDHALGSFAADAGNFREACEVAGADGRDEFFDVHPGKNFKGKCRADTGSAEKKLEEVLFAGGEETVKSEGVFADVGVDEESDFGVEFSEGGESGEWNGNEVADTSDVENHLVGTFFEEATAEKSDHRLKVLLC
jgi:hypothetical protein